MAFNKLVQVLTSQLGRTIIKEISKTSYVQNVKKQLSNKIITTTSNTIRSLQNKHNIQQYNSSNNNTVTDYIHILKQLPQQMIKEIKKDIK